MQSRLLKIIKIWIFLKYENGFQIFKNRDFILQHIVVLSNFSQNGFWIQLVVQELWVFESLRFHVVFKTVKNLKHFRCRWVRKTEKI